MVGRGRNSGPHAPSVDLIGLTFSLTPFTTWLPLRFLCLPIVVIVKRTDAVFHAIFFFPFRSSILCM